MPRVKGSGRMGVVRSLRLPLSLERWFEEQLRERRNSAASALLLELVHGGLRLVPGYMARHRVELRALNERGEFVAYAAYMHALRHTFGDRYVAHLDAWLEAATDEFCRH